MIVASAGVFAAIADPTRRALLDMLLAEEKTASALAARFDMSQQAVSQHLQSLRHAGLVDVRREGRFQYYRLTARPIREVFDWAAQYRGFFDPYGHAWQVAKGRSRSW
jgi:DNA-binding transcriptional ArsR family regulator